MHTLYQSSSSASLLPTLASPRLALADFLILCAIPHTISRYVVPDSSWSVPHLLKFIMAYLVRIRIPLVFYLGPQPHILCKIIRLCTYHLIGPPPLTLLLVLLWTIIGFRVPVAYCILARSFRFSGLIHLLIRGVFCVIQCITFPCWFHLLQRRKCKVYNGARVLGANQFLHGR
ncbi:hypothetical protein BGY98DRAFT_395191 [Russula aff. rugulosa BPL654]|nr:hypothetical protein BGY98DRAFT_395191 [Russula aff. rugulosa BPL654]